MSTLKVDTISEKTVSGGITFSQDITATLSSSSNVKAPLNATGSAPVYACRAWVNFDGTSGSGSGFSDITIRSSGNVSSITDNGTGNYTVNFTTAMPDVNYSGCVTLQRENTSVNYANVYGSYSTDTWSTTAFQIRSLFVGGTVGYTDSVRVSVAVFR